MSKKEAVPESRGLHQFDYIGRPTVWYDNRTKYNSQLEDFDRAIEERKKIGTGPISDVETIGDLVIEEK